MTSNDPRSAGRATTRNLKTPRRFVAARTRGNTLAFAVMGITSFSYNTSVIAMSLEIFLGIVFCLFALPAAVGIIALCNRADRYSLERRERPAKSINQITRGR